MFDSELKKKNKLVAYHFTAQSAIISLLSFLADS